MDEIFVLIRKGIQCPFFVRPERAPSRPSGIGGVKGNNIK